MEGGEVNDRRRHPLGGGSSPSCDGHRVVMLDGRIVTSVVLALVCTRWRCRCRLALGICHGRLVVIARLGGGVVASVILALACVRWRRCRHRRLAVGISTSSCWRGHVAGSL